MVHAMAHANLNDAIIFLHRITNILSIIVNNEFYSIFNFPFLKCLAQYFIQVFSALTTGSIQIVKLWILKSLSMKWIVTPMYGNFCVDVHKSVVAASYLLWIFYFIFYLDYNWHVSLIYLALLLKMSTYNISWTQ